MHPKMRSFVAGDALHAWTSSHSRCSPARLLAITAHFVHSIGFLSRLSPAPSCCLISCCHLVLLLAAKPLLCAPEPSSCHLDHIRHESADAVLINLVLWILALADALRERRAPQKDSHISNRRIGCPIPARVAGIAAPRVQGEPDAHLGGVVGVARVREQAARHEAAVEVFAGEV